MTVLFDKLVYLDRLKSGGLEEVQARAHAEALDLALRESVATKQDVVELHHAISETAAEFTRRLDRQQETTAHLAGRIDRLDAQVGTLTQDVHAFRADARERFVGIDRSLVQVCARLDAHEGRLDSLEKTVQALADSLQVFREQTQERFAQIDSRFDRIDMRFEAADRQIAGLRRTLDAHETRLNALSDDLHGFRADMEQRLARMEHRFDALEQRMTIKLGGMLIVAVGVMAVLQQVL